ncbi:MAG TPA: biotin--[acetyl-CoA-carboxylase] ligase [Terriglobales bacterium]|nr:biotin--[acetyl-CoA-carboxylase] ligase [Terriglobales bacterium]
MSFDIDALRALRRSSRLGARIDFYEETDSTNTRLREAGRSGAAEGLVAIAEQQSAGRGRLGRSWASPPGRNLYMSVLLRPPVALEMVPQLTLVAGLATAETAREWVPQAQIKWPNDVWVAGRKVAGILTEMEASGSQVGFVVTGIGVNLNLRADELPPELRAIAGGLIQFLPLGSEPIARDRFADRLLANLERRYLDFLSGGFAAIRNAWDDLSLLTGRQVRIDAGGELQQGEVLGIDAEGRLRLRHAAGETRVVAGDVTVLGTTEP